MNFYLLGIKIDILSKEDIGNFLRETLMQKTQHHVVTLNPEMVMWAQKDIEFKNVINDAGLRTIDGVGIVQAARLRGKKAERHTGYDLTLQVLRIAEEEEKSVFFLGGKDSHIAHLSAHYAKKLFPRLKIVGAESGPVLRHKKKTLSVDHDENEYLIEHIRKQQPNVLLVAFGHPKQEKWISQVLKELPSVKIAIGVGGVFDYLSGKIQRAPRMLRILGLEWLFRLMRQPWRLPRILTATARFMAAALREKRSQKI